VVPLTKTTFGFLKGQGSLALHAWIIQSSHMMLPLLLLAVVADAAGGRKGIMR
jgi:hypothetical protein